MNNYINLLVTLIVLLIVSGSCGTNVSQPPKEVELTKQINQMLDEIDTHQRLLLSPSNSLEGVKKDIAKGCILLIQNPKIALPLMLTRVANKKLDSYILGIYFIVFEKMKSPEAIPYISNYILSVTEEDSNYSNDITNGPGAALSAAQQITSLKLIDEKRTFFDQRKDIADKLNKWYEEYKKTKKQ